MNILYNDVKVHRYFIHLVVGEKMLERINDIHTRCMQNTDVPLHHSRVGALS